jgi:hypothetical protein
MGDDAKIPDMIHSMISVERGAKLRKRRCPDEILVNLLFGGDRVIWKFDPDRKGSFFMVLMVQISYNTMGIRVMAHFTILPKSRTFAEILLHGIDRTI